MSLITAKRPHVDERPDYVPRSPAEQFIVPLLRERIERGLDEYARPRGPRARALDVGCGRQPFRRRLEAAGYHYTGADAVQNPEGTVEFLAPIDGELPAELVAAGPFEFVLCTEVLEHVADWSAAFANLRRLSEPGGTVLLTCPQFYMLHEEPYDFWRPTGHALRAFAERAGFRVERLEALGGPREVLGTLLGFASFRPRRGGRFAAAACKLLNAAKRLAAWSLRRRFFAAGPVELTGKTYLSNFAVLRAEAVP
jgi:SAM-dependent methyltransferase